ncbi:hypothetical protein N8D56_23325 [Devosia sp. A8/3-2]|nr:hypothetical protein N8D56_23325 [Devosia sp. A8/3-2]
MPLTAMALAKAGPAPCQDDDRGKQIVLVQALADGEIEQFLTRNAVTGAPGASPINGGPLPKLPDTIEPLVALLDAKAGRHMVCSVAIKRGRGDLRVCATHAGDSGRGSGSSGRSCQSQGLVGAKCGLPRRSVAARPIAASPHPLD